MIPCGHAAARLTISHKGPKESRRRDMRIGVIQASSQKSKNEALYRCTCRAVENNGRQDTVVNFGVFPDQDASFSYIETALNISLLLSSGAVDFIVTGCSSGQGMMLACNSLPGVLCGFVQTPQGRLSVRTNQRRKCRFPAPGAQLRVAWRNQSAMYAG